MAMLVLTRKKNEQIRIADGIILTVISVQGKQTKLGIECPRIIPIRRIETCIEHISEDELSVTK